MNSIRRTGLLGALFLVMSCSGPKEDKPSPGRESSAGAKSKEKTAKAADRDPEDLLVRVAEWRDEMCACRDAECTERTHDEFNAWRKSLPRVTTKSGPHDPLERLKQPWEDLEAEMKDCRKKYKKRD